MVAISLQYLPDFEEEYALDVRTGWGAANVKIELQDGWNLVSLNQDLDSKVDKNISAMADLVRAVPHVNAGVAASDSDEARVVVQSSNVPLGFYEAVVGTDRCGKKRLYGFRYVGFIPFANCPICPSGVQSANCEDGTLDLYGLVFDRGVMVFRSIGQIGSQENPSARTLLTAGPVPPSRKMTTTTTTEPDGSVQKRVEVVEIARLPGTNQ